ncbi:MAG: hypothetical protein ACREIH_06030 [Nitrospiraceae bacterium]
MDNRLVKPEPALNATPSLKLSPVFPYFFLDQQACALRTIYV